jgi:hypothetical protein
MRRPVQPKAQSLRGSFAESAWTADWNTPRQSIAAHGDSLFRIFNSGYRAAIASLKASSRRHCRAHGQSV